MSVNPHLSFDQFKQNKDSNISKVNIIKPTVPTVGNPSDKTDKGKQVSIDGGITWSDFKDLPKHDTVYDWKSTFSPSKDFNFDGAGSLILMDTFEHLQSINGFKTATMTNEQLAELVYKNIVGLKDKSGKVVSDKFNWSIEKGNNILQSINGFKTATMTNEQLAELVYKNIVGLKDKSGKVVSDKFNWSIEKGNNILQSIIKASVKAENADEFDDLGGVNKGDLQLLTLYIHQSTVRGAKGHEEINYL